MHLGRCSYNFTVSCSSRKRLKNDSFVFFLFFLFFHLFFQVKWVAAALSVDFIFHPAALTLGFGALVNVIGDKATLPLRAQHIFVVVALGVLGRKDGVLCLHVHRRARVQFGNVAEGVRSLCGVRRDDAPHRWF